MGKKAIGVLLVGLALAFVRISDAQQPAKLPKIGWLEARSASALGRNLFGRQLREPAYVEGMNIAFEDRLPIGDENKNPGDTKLGERKRGRPRRTFEPWRIVRSRLEASCKIQSDECNSLTAIAFPRPLMSSNRRLADVSHFPVTARSPPWIARISSPIPTV